MAETITLTVDQLIELLETLKEKDIPPPSTVDRLPHTVRDNMRRAGEASFDITYDEDSEWEFKAGGKLYF